MGLFDFFSDDKDGYVPPGASPTLLLPVHPEPGELKFSRERKPSSGDERTSHELGLPLDASPESGAPPLTFDPKIKEWPPRTSEYLHLPVQPEEGSAALQSAEWKDREKHHESDRKSNMLQLPADPEPGDLIMSMPMRRHVTAARPHFQPITGQESIELEELHLLVDEQKDDLIKSRTREAVWLSIIFHFLLIATLRYAPKYLFRDAVILTNPADRLSNKKDLTYLSLPPDLQRAKLKPNANVISDKDREAISRNPKLEKLLQQLRDNRAMGAPAQPTPQPQTPTPGPEVAQAAPPKQDQPRNDPKSATRSIQFETPPSAPTTNAFRMGGSASSNIEQAMRGSAAARGNSAGDWGNGSGNPNSHNAGALDILSDTQGVDFEPYLKRVVESVRVNWYNIIPEIARPPLSKKGMVAIEFLITKDGKVAGMRLVGPSGDVSLDRAAWGGIQASNPFQPLPSEFKGEYLALRFRFYYNPDRGEIR